MEFYVKKDDFNKAISDVSRAVSSKTPFPILTGIKIIADSNGLTLIGSNSDIYIQRDMPLILNGEKVVEVMKTGSVVLSSKYLPEIVKKLPDNIHIKVNEKKNVVMTSNDIEINLNGFDAKEYPSLPVMDKDNKIRIESEKILEVIQNTVFAASKSDKNPVLTGVNMIFTSNEITFLATNSHRLSMKKVPIDSIINGSATVPAASLNELVKLIGQRSEIIDMFVTSSHILFHSSVFSLYSRLIAGKFPKVSGLIPTDPKTTLMVNTKQLLQAIDRACIFANEWKNNNIRFKIEGNCKIRLSSNSSEIGKIEESITVKHLTGDRELCLSFDGKFMADALKSLENEDVKLSFGGAMSPILIEAVEDPSQLHMISPVRSR